VLPVSLRLPEPDCSRCRSLVESRSRIVPGVGPLPARVMFVGEGPGAEEDRQGEPFVGPAGQWLTKMITSLGLERTQVRISNAVLCRPEGNRQPTGDEMGHCHERLAAELAACDPEIVVALGATALAALTGQTGVTRLRGTWQNLRPELAGYEPSRGRPPRVLVMKHPAVLCYNEAGELPGYRHDVGILRHALEEQPAPPAAPAPMASAPAAPAGPEPPRPDQLTLGEW